MGRGHGLLHRGEHGRLLLHLGEERWLLDWRTLDHRLVVSVIQHLLGLHSKNAGCCIVQRVGASSNTSKTRRILRNTLQSVLFLEVVFDFAASKEWI